MRKIVAISTLLIYLSLSAVQVISVHLCHGKLESIALLEEKGDGCNGMHSCHSSCCEDIVIKVDFDRDHIYSEEISVNPSDQVFELNYLVCDLVTNAGTAEAITYPASPGPLIQPKLYTLHASFLFYG